MQTALLTPPVSPPPSSPFLRSTLEPSDPVARLDVLLEIYLHLLNTYQKLREELSKNFSAGFLSLAHANRTSNLGSGRRYGEERYDERMKAGRGVSICTKDEGELVGAPPKVVETGEYPVPGSNPEIICYTTKQFSLPEVDSSDPARNPMPAETTAEALSHSSRSPPADFDSKTPNSTTPSSSSPALMSASVTPPTQSTNQGTMAKMKAKKPLLDPLNWYGVLVPPSLRAAQNSFTSAVEDQIPQLLSVQSEMAGLEVQIRQLRREVGVSHLNAHESDGTVNTITVDAEADDMQAFADEGNCLGNRKGNTCLKADGRKIVSARPKEPPRSRVLKLDS